MITIATYYLKLIIIVSFLCWLFSWMIFFQKKQNFFSIVFILSLLFIILQSTYLVIWGFSLGLQPSSVVFLCAFFINIFFIIMLQRKKEIYWALVLPGFVFFLMLLSFFFLEQNHLFLKKYPNFQTLLLSLHIVCFVFTYLILSMLLANNLLFLVRNFQLKKKNISKNKNFPSIDKLRKNSKFFTNLVFFSLSIANFLVLFLPASYQNQSFSWNGRIVNGILFWGIYGVFILMNNLFSFSYTLEAKVNIFFYFLAIGVFFFEARYFF